MSALGRLDVLALLVRRSLRQHLLSTVVTIVSTAFAAGLVMSVFGIAARARDSFGGAPLGFDAVLGARGSELQLVLNAVYHLETSPGNLPWSLYERVRDDETVATALPYAVGDSWRGYRIVGTRVDLFTGFELQRGQALRMRGRPFDPERREAVVGATVARSTGLTLGSSFHPSHGVGHTSRAGEEATAHDEDYVVVGVLEPTSSPADRVIWIPIDGVFRMEGHVLGGAGERFTAHPGEAIPDEHKEVSAVLLVLRGPQAGFQLARRLDAEGYEATLAHPVGRAMGELFDKLGWMSRVLELVAALVVVVACGSILASLHNTMNERRRELAVLRALGASRRTVFATIVLESTTVAAAGALLGYGVYAAVFTLVAGVLRERTGVVLDVLQPHAALVWTPVAIVALGTVAGLVPAARAYSTDVARNLGIEG